MLRQYIFIVFSPSFFFHSLCLLRAHIRPSLHFFIFEMCWHQVRILWMLCVAIPVAVRTTIMRKLYCKLVSATPNGERNRFERCEPATLIPYVRNNPAKSSLHIVFSNACVSFSVTWIFDANSISFNFRDRMIKYTLFALSACAPLIIHRVRRISAHTIYMHIKFSRRMELLGVEHAFAYLNKCRM